MFLFWAGSSDEHLPAGPIILMNKGSIKKIQAAWFGQCFAILTKQNEPRGDFIQPFLKLISVKHLYDATHCPEKAG